MSAGILYILLLGIEAIEFPTLGFETSAGIVQVLSSCAHAKNAGVVFAGDIV